MGRVTVSGVADEDACNQAEIETPKRRRLLGGRTLVLEGVCGALGIFVLESTIECAAAEE